MAVHVSTLSAFALGRGQGGRGGGRFWCAFEIAALTAPTVASASSHCMHKLVYSSLGALARASPASYGPPLCHPRAAAAAAAAGDAEAGASPAAAAVAGGGITSRSPAPPAPSAGGGAAGGTSTCGGEEAFEVTVLVVMNGVGRFLVPDVGTGDRVYVTL
jgi:hypothetical protein